MQGGPEHVADKAGSPWKQAGVVKALEMRVMVARERSPAATSSG